MSKKILIDGAFPNQYRVALVNPQNKIEDIEYETANIHQIKSNIYLAKVARIEPGLQAAFIDYGGGKNGFLPFSEIHPGYYNIPIADVEKYSAELSNLQGISEPSAKIDDAELEPSAEIVQKLNNDPDISDIEKLIESNSPELINNDSSDSDFEKISDGDDEFVPLYKRYKIQEVIKRGQIILVQAIKEERGNKGASFTSFISLAGKYCVLMPNNPGHHGISRKISYEGERRRLKGIISKLLSENDSKIASIIIRTAGMGRSASDIKRDYEYLVKLWNRIRELTLKSKAPSLIHIEEGIIQKTIRDLYDSAVSEIVVEGEEAYTSAVSFMEHLLPNDTRKIKNHKAPAPIFTSYDIETQISSLYQQFVHLPSGGYIVINPTEALTSIDVNSGKSTSERNIEETALKTNVEAAKEIAKQMKLRDISGLIVIDFIDMYESKNRKIVEHSLKEFVSKDKARIQIGGISIFGLMELSRQRLRPSFLESHTKMCSHCNGKGIVRDEEANSMVILRTIENEIRNLDSDILNVYANPNVTLYLLNHKRFEIAFVEEKYGIKINFLIDLNTTSDGFSIEKISLPTYGSVATNQKPVHNNESFAKIENDVSELEEKRKEKPSSKRKKWKDNDQPQKKLKVEEEQSPSEVTEIEPKEQEESSLEEAQQSDANEIEKKKRRAQRRRSSQKKKKAAQSETDSNSN